MPGFRPHDRVASATFLAQRVHVGIWYILRPQRGSHVATLRTKYIPYTYMDPLGMFFSAKMIVGFRAEGYIEFSV